MVIDRPTVDAMIEHLRAGFPNEACGLLATKDGTVVKHYPLTNAAASPVRYEIDSREQLRAMLEIDDEGWELGAIYHSHTYTRAYPSPTDVAAAHYPEALYVIVSLATWDAPEIRAYTIRDGQIEEALLDFAEVSGQPRT